jgi:hypothetical protein
MWHVAGKQLTPRFHTATICEGTSTAVKNVKYIIYFNGIATDTVVHAATSFDSCAC